MNGGQFRWRHLYLKISFRGGEKITHLYVSPVIRYKHKLGRIKGINPPIPPRWHWRLIEQKLRLYCYVYENKNLNIFLITFLMGRECLLIMQRSVVIVSDRGVRWESNMHFGGWRDASSAEGKVRVDTLWQKGEIRSDNKGKSEVSLNRHKGVLSFSRLHLNFRCSIESSHDY